MAHKHTWTGLWWHLGKYGRQDVHIHQCFTPSCEATMYGAMRNCVQGALHRQDIDAIPVRDPILRALLSERDD